MSLMPSSGEAGATFSVRPSATDSYISGKGETLMLRITVEMVPLGLEKNKHTIATAEIWNDATGTTTQGNYGYRLFSKGKLYREGFIKGFARTKENAWKLIGLVLADALDIFKAP
jgi:hypothetical protein